MAQFTEDEKIMRRLEQRFNKGVVKYRLIEDGDKILIGLSGGKDSLALLELLARRSRILKPKFTVIAVHVGMTNIPYQSDLEYLKGYSEDLGRSEERRVGKECASMCRSRWSPYH